MALSLDEKMMRAALREAKKAREEGEVPIGCVIAKDGVIVSRGRNSRERKKNALHHAEILAIHKACKKLGGWRLWQCDLYVTLEPCPMCTGAIINSRIRRVVYAATDPKAGAMESVVRLTDYPFNHKPEILSGCMEEEAKELLQSFFAELRNRNKQSRNSSVKCP